MAIKFVASDNYLYNNLCYHFSDKPEVVPVFKEVRTNLTDATLNCKVDRAYPEK